MYPPRKSDSDQAPVATVLTPAERLRVDAAGEGTYRTLHRDSLEDVIRDLKERPVSAVLISVARCGERESARMAVMVKEFPRVPAVALLTRVEDETPQAVLALGRSGVRRLVDVRQANGWRELRSLLVADRTDDVQRLALASLRQELIDAPEDCWRFFEGIFQMTPRVSTVRALARQLGVLPSTLMSRFFRSKLPPPKRYLAMARLTRAARLFENPGLSVANVANHLDYSSPQSFGRHVRTLLGVTAVHFREQYDGERMLERFQQDLVRPYRDVLRTFTPLTAPPGWVPGRRPPSPASSSIPRSG